MDSDRQKNLEALSEASRARLSRLVLLGLRKRLGQDIGINKFRVHAWNQKLRC